MKNETQQERGPGVMSPAELKEANFQDYVDLAKVGRAVRAAGGLYLQHIEVASGVPARRAGHLARKYGATGLRVTPIQYWGSHYAASGNGAFGRAKAGSPGSYSPAMITWEGRKAAR